MDNKANNKDNFILKVKSLIDSAFPLTKKDTVIVSLSGGLDSVCLFSCMNLIKAAYGFALKAFHINYQLRHKESERDESFVTELCKNMGIELIKTRESKVKSVKRGENNQLWARRMRIEHYEKLKKLYPNVKIALGHHLDDQIETFFLRLIRGSGPKGLSGIKPLSRGYIVRPFLNISKAELFEFAERLKINFVEDSSNYKKDYFRNWVRAEIIVRLDEQSFYKNTKERIAGLMELLGKEDKFLSNLGRKYFKKVLIKSSQTETCIELESFRKIPEILRKRIIRRCVHKIVGTLKGYSLSHIELIDSFAQAKSGSKKLNLPMGLYVVRSYDCLTFTVKDTERVTDFSYSVKPPCGVFINELRKNVNLRVIHDEAEIDNTKQYLDFEKISKKLSIRNFRDGDRIIVDNSQGLRKIKNFFIGRKIPWSKRKSIPFLIDGKKVAAILGVTVDLRYRVCEDTRKFLEISLSV